MAAQSNRRGMECLRGVDRAPMISAMPERGAEHINHSSFRTPRSGDPTALAGLQARTPKAARRASAKEGASQPSDFALQPKAMDSGLRRNDEQGAVRSSG